METKRFRNHFSDVIEQLGGLLIFLFIVGVQSIPDILSDTDGDSNDVVALIDNPKYTCLLYTSPSPRDAHESRMPSSA